MTYQEFSIKLQEQCPDNYLVRDLVLQETQQICGCMHKTIVEKWPNMNYLLVGIRQLDREPRGEADLIPSAIRIAAPYCMKSKK